MGDTGGIEYSENREVFDNFGFSGDLLNGNLLRGNVSLEDEKQLLHGFSNL